MRVQTREQWGENNYDGAGIADRFDYYEDGLMAMAESVNFGKETYIPSWEFGGTVGANKGYIPGVLYGYNLPFPTGIAQPLVDTEYSEMYQGALPLDSQPTWEEPQPWMRFGLYG